MDPKYALRTLLDAVRHQIAARLPVATYGSATPMDVRDLADLLPLVRRYAAAERDYAALPDPPPPGDG